MYLENLYILNIHKKGCCNGRHTYGDTFLYAMIQYDEILRSYDIKVKIVSSLTFKKNLYGFGLLAIGARL